MTNYLSNEKLREPCLRNLFLAPFLGAMLVVALPFIGYYLVMKWIWEQGKNLIFTRTSEKAA